MQIRKADIQNFKGLRELTIDFTSPGSGEPRGMTCLIGGNGSGKTTALQAIGLPISLATRQTRFPHEFEWHGFMAERVSSLGPTRVELQINFTEREVALTRELYQRWYDSLSQDWRENHQIVEPSDHRQVTLVYENGRLEADRGYAALNQFLGRYYVKILSKTQPQLRDHFHNLGDVFWFDQLRNLGSARSSDSKNVHGWQAGVEQLREFLVGWWGYHTSPSRGAGRDYVAELQRKFNQVFPSISFIGLAPRSDANAHGAADFYFLLNNDGKVYDLAEMSSGEQAVFPLIYEFVRLDIGNSIVMVDELELHLHPPQQQTLLNALRSIGADCQVIVTTHSPFLTEAIPDDQEIRLEGGRRCL